ncbi:25232_t:CDS:2 [Cetraspora pellucida]|uniref:25232_t:CDS:1 n=1 Tax=Cetraspora pellucida TaxID=1433469 RepID=A0A9N9AYM8_9GLOM|nr:25232_t:CDS:2 [Cetraspora pellucida]
MDSCPEPRLKTTKYFLYKCERNILGVDMFFIFEPASKWSLEIYVNHKINNRSEYSFDQVKELFVANLKQIHELRATPLAIRSLCDEYIKWLETWKGIAVTEACRKYYNAQKQYDRKRKYRNVVGETISEQAQAYVFDEHLNAEQKQEALKSSKDHEQRCTTPPPRRVKTDEELLSTPNKRIVDHDSVVLYLEAMGNKIVQNQVVNRDRLPTGWTDDLFKYLDNAFDKPSYEFKTAIMEHIKNEPENKFRLYCEKVLMDFYNLVDIRSTLSRNIKERKYIVQHISSLFKFYESTFETMVFDWIESHSPATKISKSSTNSGIVLVDGRGTRVLDDKDMWHMEVAGPPSVASKKHTINDTIKSLHTDLFNLVAILMEHLDCPVETATKIKVLSSQIIGYRMTLYTLNMSTDGSFHSSELASAVFPFSFDARAKFKAIFRLMFIFHDEIVEQISIMQNLDMDINYYQGRLVRDVLDIPKGLKDLLQQDE